jgi:hypothetical protein
MSRRKAMTTTEAAAGNEPLELATHADVLSLELVNRLLFKYDQSPDFGVHEFHAEMLALLPESATTAAFAKARAEERNTSTGEPTPQPTAPTRATRSRSWTRLSP